MTKDKDNNIKLTLPKKEDTIKINGIKEEHLKNIEKVEEMKIKALEKDTKKSKEETVDLESVLRQFKFSGLYHVKFMLLIGALAFFSSCHSTNYVFAVEKVGYRCKYEGCTELSTIDQNTTIDYKCHKYKVINSNGSCTKENFDVSQAMPCDKWVYDKTNSFVAELNIGCEDWKRTLVGTMHSAGYMIGLFLVGPISDKYGRKNLIIFASIASAIIGLAKSMVYSYWVYVILEALEPLLGDSYSPTFTLAIETVTKEHRPLVISILGLFTALGGACMAVVAWLTPNWRTFLIIIYAPGFIFIMYIFWMDESVRWLLNKGRKSKVDDIIRQVAKTNNIVVDENQLRKLKCEENSSSSSLISLVKLTFSSKKLFIRLLSCICMWFTSLFNTYALMINSVSLKGNKYLNYGLTVLTGVPGCVLLWYLLTRGKRKKPLFFSFLTTGAFCMAHALIPADYSGLSILLYVCGKFTSVIAIRIVYIYTSELFPTYTRNTMHALCSALGRTAALLAPQTPLLMEYWPGLPSLIMGILSTLTAAVVTLMPDTADDVLPDNVRQAEEVGKKEKEVKLDACSKL